MTKAVNWLHILLVSQNEPRIEQFIRTEAVGLEATLRLPSLENTLSLAEVFARVDFTPTPLRASINRLNRSFLFYIISGHFMDKGVNTALRTNRGCESEGTGWVRQLSTAITAGCIPGVGRI